MNSVSILSALFDQNIGNTLSTDYSILFCDTIKELLSVNTPDIIMQQVLLLYSTYRSLYHRRHSIKKEDINYYHTIENKLKNGAYTGGSSQPENKTKSVNATDIIQPKVFQKLYSNWLQSTKDYLNHNISKISGSSNSENTDNSDSSANDTSFKIDNERNKRFLDIQQLQSDEQFNQMFYTLGLIYGSLLQFLKDLHTINSEYDLDITGFVDENSKLKPICELANYAVSVVSLVDAVLEIIVNQGVLDIRLLKPILRIIGINFEDIEYYYNEAIHCIMEFQNMNDMSNNTNPDMSNNKIAKTMKNIFK